MAQHSENTQKFKNPKDIVLLLLLWTCFMQIMKEIGAAGKNLCILKA